ncbi:putative alcohol dehydrogenase [Phytophthora cinnamomi]|uniref:putative alcohol dehydrogenase n=1 Tax=Phytophthora cinnamomi TaxID=4785 RepID=UPI00355A2A93|nr:putative alcohol dehydrogenase [Phytophthora cinnamomi]
MGTPAARRSMPHHRVPERKEASPVFERLRSELNWMVRHRVTEAVDAVCAAFEDELTRLAQPTDPPYELFYGCCSRLTRFIDSNMGTTPGFVQEMDRLIFACHCGASGKAVRKAMTKDLQIRRRQKTAAKVEGDTEQPADPSSKTSIARKKTAAETAGDESGVSSDDSVGKPAPVGMASRQWATRKRLSTRSHSAGVKRLKRSPKSGRDYRENDKKPEFFKQDVATEKQREDVVELDVAKEEEKREDIDKERVCNEEKQCKRARASPRKARTTLSGWTETQKKMESSERIEDCYPVS